MLDRMVEKAREQEVFSREDTPESVVSNADGGIGTAFTEKSTMIYNTIKRPSISYSAIDEYSNEPSVFS